jgi:hypothetical protein
MKLQKERSGGTSPKASMRTRNQILEGPPKRSAPPSPLFSQVFILNGVKVLCFDTLLQVFILKGLTRLTYKSPRLKFAPDRLTKTTK